MTGGSPEHRFRGDGIHLMHVNAAGAPGWLVLSMGEIHPLPDNWRPVSIAPEGVDLEVCAIDRRGTHQLIFPVRRCGTEWVDASMDKVIDIVPTHWRKWDENRGRG
jgi:hypothetical protein